MILFCFSAERISSIFKGYYQYWLAAIPILFIGYGTAKFMDHSLSKESIYAGSKG